MQKVNIIDQLNNIMEYWEPKVVGELNGQYVKLVKFQGEFIWHKHENEDELFFVVSGKFKMEFRDKTVEVNENEFLIVPHGVEHRSVAEEEVWIMLFEPTTTTKTGNIAVSI
ncbi:MAG: cupin domain-containing protein [Candidatus Kapabacteria bacterium]|nr:cupin domain-containing protein [Candidatus Kapabacteria bacterium]